MTTLDENIVQLKKDIEMYESRLRCATTHEDDQIDKGQMHRTRKTKGFTFISSLLVLLLPIFSSAILLSLLIVSTIS